MSTTSITAAQLSQVQSALSNQNVAGAWQLLSSFGDQYATSAYQVIANPTSFYGETARNAWSAAGVSASTFNSDFNAVALAHLTNYVSDIEAANAGGGTYSLPTTTQIESSYIDALQQYGITPYAAVDSSLAVISDASNGAVGNWYMLLGIDPSRIGPTSSDVTNNITQSGALAQFSATTSLTAQTMELTTATNADYTTLLGGLKQDMDAINGILGQSTSAGIQAGGLTFLYDSVTGDAAIFDNSSTGYVYVAGQAFAINSSNFRIDPSTGDYEFYGNNNAWNVAVHNDGSGLFADVDCTLQPGGYSSITGITLSGSSSSSAPATVSNTNVAVTSGSSGIAVSGNYDDVTVGSNVSGANGAWGADVNGWYNTVNQGSNSTIAVNGGGSTINEAAGDNLDLYNVSGDTVNANNASMLATSNASFSVNGGGNAVTLAQQDISATVSNSNVNTWGSTTGNTVSGTGDTVNLGAGSSTNVFDGNDTINVQSGSNTYVGLLDGSGFVVNDSNNDINFADAEIQVNGSGNLIGLIDQGDTLYGSNNNVQMGTDLTNSYIDGTSNNIDETDGSSINIGGNDNNINDTAGAYLGIVSGIDDGISASQAQISTLGDTSFYLSGYNNNITLGNGQSGADAGLLSGVGNAVTAFGGDVLSLFANTTTSEQGSGSTVAIDGSGDNLNVIGTGVAINVAAGESSESITASNETFDIGSNVSVDVYGSGDVINGGSGDDIYADGSNDTAYATDSTIDFSGSGDNYDGSGDDGSGGDNGGGDGNYGGYGYDGGYAFASKAAATGANIGKIASYDASLTDQAAAVAAETAKLEAAAAANSTAAPTPQFEGPKWSSDTITWSLATSPGNMGTPFSGYLGSQYESTVEQAFSTWAAASGLKFEEVADSAQSDIRIGWSTFNAASSGVLGYTSVKSLNGSLEAGVAISLEDPTEDALTTDANGQLAYSGSNVELSQLLLHEIGHALGLADNADASSVMSAVLSSSNQTLDATDIAGIADLYPIGGAVSSAASALTSLVGVKSIATTALTASATSSLSAYTAQAAQLIESMASFSSASSSSSLITVPPTLGSSLSSAMALAVAA